MLPINHILVPVEIHENVAPVIAWAAAMARALRGRLTLLHVNESVGPLIHRSPFQGGAIPETTTMVVNEWRSAYNQTAQRELTRLVEQYCDGIAVETLLLEGRAHATILELLEQTACDLIVMGTHGRPWYQRLLIGSTAEAVLRAAALPVLIVHNLAPLQNPPQLTKLLLPIDFSTGDSVSEQWASHLAGLGGGEVVLMHVIENPLLDMYRPDSAIIDLRRIMEESRQHPPRSAQPFWEHAHQTAHDTLTRMQQRFVDAHVRATLTVREGPAAEEILRAVKEKAVDLIVMPTHGRSGVQRLLLGSVTEKVVRAASCPVLVVRSKEAANAPS